MKWNVVGTNQYGHVIAYYKLPKEKKHVLCQIKSTDKTLPDCIVLGYLKYAAGCKDSPRFVCPGYGGQVLAWCDCIKSGFTWPTNPA